jgi:hypothetical protein
MDMQDVLYAITLTMAMSHAQFVTPHVMVTRPVQLVIQYAMFTPESRVVWVAMGHATMGILIVLLATVPVILIVPVCVTRCATQDIPHVIAIALVMIIQLVLVATVLAMQDTQPVPVI